jgi:ferredoxin
MRFGLTEAGDRERRRVNLGGGGGRGHRHRERSGKRRLTAFRVDQVVERVGDIQGPPSGASPETAMSPPRSTRPPTSRETLCNGYGVCEALAPDVFTLGDDRLAVLRTGMSEDEAVREACESCPMGAIAIAKLEAA